MGRKTLHERFHEKYRICPESECWIWEASTVGNGYGQIRVHGRLVLAHRLSFELHKEPIPENDSYHGMCVLHKCDTPRCVNPDHLLLGTHEDNVDDMMQKGRHKVVMGSAHVNAKLTEEQALEIFHAEGDQKEIAARYGVTQAAVSLIKRKKNWKHIHGS